MYGVLEAILVSAGVLSVVIWIQQIVMYAAMYKVYRKFVPFRRKNETISQTV